MHGTGDVAVRTSVVLLVMFFVAISGCVQKGALVVDCGSNQHQAHRHRLLEETRRKSRWM